MQIAAFAGAMAPSITIDKRPERFAVATINRAPVNSMNLDLWRELLQVPTFIQTSDQ